MPHNVPAKRPAQRQLAPLDLPMVPFVLVGMAIWLVAVAILAPMHDTLTAQGRGDWLWICVAGFVSGVPGLALMLVHDRNRRRRRQAAAERS